MAVCPFARSGAALPAGHPPLPPPPPLPTFTLASLLAAGSAATDDVRRVPLVAVKGAILDVSNEPRCVRPDGVWHAALGRDLTRTLAFTSIRAVQAQEQAQEQGRAIESNVNSDISSRASDWPLHLAPEYQGARALEGLGFDELRALETWAAHLSRHCPTIGRLLTAHEEGDATVSLALPGEETLPPLPSDIYGSFLPLVEQLPPASEAGSAAAAASGEASAPVSLHSLLDADARAELVSSVLSLPHGSPLLASVCHRSGMAVLHRAVENDWPDVVEALVARGANLHTPCALYDGDTPIELARRFKAGECERVLEAATAAAAGAGSPSPA